MFSDADGASFVDFAAKIVIEFHRQFVVEENRRESVGDFVAPENDVAVYVEDRAHDHGAAKEAVDDGKIAGKRHVQRGAAGDDGTVGQPHLGSFGHHHAVVRVFESATVDFRDAFDVEQQIGGVADKDAVAEFGDATTEDERLFVAIDEATSGRDERGFRIDVKGLHAGYDIGKMALVNFRRRGFAEVHH